MADLKKVAAKTRSSLRKRLGPLGVWACAALFALAVAILAGRSEAGAQRLALVVSSLSLGSSQSFHQGPSEPEVSTKQLAEALRGLTQDQDRLTTRLVAVERGLDDMTGSITKQIEAARSAPPDPLWPDDKATTPEAIAAMLAPPSIATMPSPAGPDETAAAAMPTKGYGADIGGSPSIKSLHARWMVLRAAHPQLLDGLRAGVTIHENARTNKTELRLVVGPFASAEAAGQLCASLAALKLSCQPTMFDGRLALQ
jgi:hypothetical protein